MGKHEHHTPATAASGIEDAIHMLEGRWKLVILFHLFGGKKLRFSDLERAIPAISQKMLIQPGSSSKTESSRASSTLRCHRRSSTT